MPLSIYEVLKLPLLKRSAARFILADKSIISVVGIAEDVLVSIKGLVFPIDFHILKMPPSDSSRTSSILLGRPFLKTSRFKLDAFSGTYSFEIDKREVSFNLDEAMKHPPEDYSIFRCDLIDNVVAKVHQDGFDGKSMNQDPTVDYVSKWVEAIPTRTDDANIVLSFVRNNIICRFGSPRAIVSNQGLHFCNKRMAVLMKKYGIMHEVAMAYHPKQMAKLRKYWSSKLGDALWAKRTAYKMPIGLSPFWLIYGKACHLPVEIEHKAYWAIKECNIGFGVGVERKLQLVELENLRLEAYENSRLYKEKMKELRSRWEGPYRVEKAELYGVYHLRHPSSPNIFKVNGHRLKLYHREKMKSNNEVDVFLLEDAPNGREI
ncbi:uncharacterized protein [Arachis hypogaea]|uniref:uncharacterized protein n=1 Tax=Arachis hypogaea TaxID=3818 RepID=UPI000DECF0C9|nr:uncharacterized protein LOC112717498 [Arachis hypogaea]